MIKNEVVDEDKEEENIDEERMIVVGTILCPLKIGQFFFYKESQG